MSSSASPNNFSGITSVFFIIVDGFLDSFRPLLTIELPDPDTASIAASIWQEAAAALRRWQAFKAAIPALDYDDLQLTLLDRLLSSPEFRSHCQALFDHILVDEFQDTNRLQQRIVWALAGLEPASETPARVFLVGDAKQSIYRFRRADIVTYNEVKSIIARDPNGAVVHLSSNFRTRGALIDWVNEALGKR